MQEEEESPAIQAIMKGMEAMQVSITALAAAQAGGGVVANVDAVKPKTEEEAEIEKRRAENERLRSTQADGNWEQRYRPKGRKRKRASTGVFHLRWAALPKPVPTVARERVLGRPRWRLWCWIWERQLRSGWRWIW